jgi:hypothetical protein
MTPITWLASSSSISEPKKDDAFAVQTIVNVDPKSGGAKKGEKVQNEANLKTKETPRRVFHCQYKAIRTSRLAEIQGHGKPPLAHQWASS